MKKRIKEEIMQFVTLKRKVAVKVDAGFKS